MALTVRDHTLLNRLKSAAVDVEDLGGMSNWICKNTTHPKNDKIPWSFEGHEFQEDIVNDEEQFVGVQKCSQVGVSEVFARWVLAFLVKFHRTTAIYTLPTTGQVRDFSPGRIDPIIEGSAYLQEMTHGKIDNTGLKRIGTSFLYIKGTFTQRGAISVPGRLLVNDEVDFSDPVTMTTFISRLGHEADGGIRRLFSTPTVEGYGISAALKGTTRARYGVKCRSCKKMVFPEFLRDVEIPGFQDHLSEFEKDDLTDTRYDIRGAFLHCPECRNEITHDNLLDVDARQWVAETPEAEQHGYFVHPTDCPSFKSVPKVIKSLDQYRRFADWVNFEIGDTFEDAENSFLEAAITKSPRSQFILPAEHAASGCILGCDVGKVSNVVIAKPTGRHRFDIVFMERFKATADKTLLQHICELHVQYGVVRGVIDAGPDLVTPPGYVNWADLGQAYACYYARKMKVTSLSHIHVNEDEGIVTAVRTEAFDRLAKLVNSASVGFPVCGEMKVMRDHLRAMKRVKSYNAQGDEVLNWTNTGPDHYAHALNYMNIAFDLMDEKFMQEVALPVLPMMSRVGVIQPKAIDLHKLRA